MKLLITTLLSFLCCYQLFGQLTCTVETPEFSLSPNPTQEILKVSVENGSSNESWRIVNQQGKDVLSGSFMDESGIDISEQRWNLPLYSE